MNELSLFAGAGGGILGGKLLGWRTVCAVEIDPYCAGVLVQRQNDGILAPFPVWDDVTTFDGKPWRGVVDVISGGFPCQDISCAGKGAGIEGERSGLWGEFARIIGEVRPQYVFVENSPLLVSRGLSTVLGDLAKMGYNARWGIVGADDAGAPHRRKRIWIVANTEIERQQEGCELRPVEPTERISGESIEVSDTDSERFKNSPKRYTEIPKFGCGNKRKEDSQRSWWSAEPAVGRVANGVAYRVDRLKAIGNGQVPAVARLAWNIISERK